MQCINKKKFFYIKQGFILLSCSFDTKLVLHANKSDLVLSNQSLQSSLTITQNQGQNY